MKIMIEQYIRETYLNKSSIRVEFIEKQDQQLKVEYSHKEGLFTKRKSETIVIGSWDLMEFLFYRSNI